MRKRSVLKLTVICVGILLGRPGTAQDLEALKQKYPGEEAVLLNAAEHYTIKMKDGKPYVESTETQQLLYLSGNAAAYMSRYGFSHSSFHELREYEAFTQTAEKKKIKVTDFKTSNSQSSSVFYDDVKETRFDFPAITAGAIGNLQVTVVHNNPYLLSPYYFARSIPVINNTLTVSFPKEISIKYVLKGLNTDKIQFTQDTRRGETTYTFRVNELAAEKAYGDAPGGAWYSPHVVFYIDKYKNEQGEMVNYLSNTDDLYKLNSSFIKNINKEASAELKHIVDSLTGSVTSREEKARRIYSWVQQNIKYVAFEEGMEGFVPREASLVCSRRFGDCKDMSSILTVMLNAAGVPAYYTWIGTRSLPYSYLETPLPIVDNHMICTIELKKGEYIFLDGTDPSCVFGIPSGHIQDKEAMVAISPTEYKVIKVPVPPKETSRLEDSTFIELTDKGIKGNIALHLSGYYSMEMHSTLTYTNGKDMEEYMKKRFSRGSNKFNLVNYEIGDLGNKDQVAIKARFELQDFAKKIGDEWFLNLNLLKLYEHQEIDFPRRKMPMEFDFRSVNRYVTVLKLPDGYTVSYLPPSKSYKNDIWGFTIRYEQKGNTIVFTQEFDNDHLLLQYNQFEAWNEVLKNLFPQYKESISISKKN
jgi:hypothetical protein